MPERHDSTSSTPVDSLAPLATSGAAGQNPEGRDERPAGVYVVQYADRPARVWSDELIPDDVWRKVPVDPSPFPRMSILRHLFGGKR